MEPLAEEDPTTIDFSSEDEEDTDDEQQAHIPTEVTNRSPSPLLIYDPLPFPTLLESHSAHTNEVDPSLQPAAQLGPNDAHKADLVPLGAQFRDEDADEVSPLKRGRDQSQDDDTPRAPPNMRPRTGSKRHRQMVDYHAHSNGLRSPSHSMHSLTADLLRLGDVSRNDNIELYELVDSDTTRLLNKESLAALPSDAMISIRKSDLFSLAAGFQIGARNPPKLHDYSTDQDAKRFMDDTIVAALDTEHRHRQEFNRRLDRIPDMERFAIPKVNCELSIGRVALTQYQAVRWRYY